MLRDYQQEAVDACLSAMRNGCIRPLIVMPTGSGKSLVLAEIAKRVVGNGGRVLIATHVKELVEQNAAACERLGLKVGVCSAGIGRREFEQDVVVCGVQTACRMPESFGKRHVVIVDECHRLPVDGDGQYHTLLNGLRHTNPQVRLVGLTATPYRTGSGMLTDGDPALFDEIVYEAQVRDLIEKGWLSPLRTKCSVRPDLAGVHTVAGDYNEKELSERLMPLVPKTVDDILARAADCKKILVFGIDVAHATALAEGLRARGLSAPLVVGSTPSDERKAIVDGFRRGEFRALVNCAVFTTGFDVPDVDCVAMVRPTQSPGLYAQIVGRGMRRAEGKATCLILDYGDNIVRHGPIDAIQPKKSGTRKGVAPVKICPECQEAVPLSVRVCPGCQYAWPEREKVHSIQSSEASILSEPTEFFVNQWSQTLVKTKSGKMAMKVSYMVGSGNLSFIDEWVCFDHAGYARMKAEEWWIRHGGRSIPATALDAVRERGHLVRPASIEAVQDGRYWKILRRTMPVKPVQAQ